MAGELESLMAALPPEATAEEYRRAIIADNVLRKATASNREKTHKFLGRLYALDPETCLFRELRRLHPYAAADGRLLIGLLAMAREPLLRECADMVLSVPVGENLGRPDFEAWIRGYAAGRFSETMYVSFSHNLYASFHQLGFLGESSGSARGRTRPQAGIASAAYAAFLDWLDGMSGVALLRGRYSRVLDLDPEGHISLLMAAVRQGLLRGGYSGGVLDLAFPGFLKEGETRPEP